MAKSIKITIVELGITCTAELMEDDAPKTCAAMWKVLEKPLECRARHSIWCGRKLTLNVPKDHHIVDAKLLRHGGNPAGTRTRYSRDNIFPRPFLCP